MKSISSIYFKTVFYPDSPQRGRSDFSKSEGNHTLEDKQASTNTTPLLYPGCNSPSPRYSMARWPSGQAANLPRHRPSVIWSAPHPCHHMLLQGSGTVKTQCKLVKHSTPNTFSWEGKFLSSTDSRQESLSSA